MKIADYEYPWIFNGQPFLTEDINKAAGFVYLITNTINSKAYIGRKYFENIRKKKGQRNRVRTESDWKDYYSSSDELKADVEKYGKEFFQREIISIHKTRGDCNYQEVKQQFLFNVLEEDGFYNGNINGKWKKIKQHIIEDRRLNSIINIPK